MVLPGRLCTLLPNFTKLMCLHLQMPVLAARYCKLRFEVTCYPWGGLFEWLACLDG